MSTQRICRWLNLITLFIGKNMLIKNSQLPMNSQLNPLRDTITNAYRMNETECLEKLIPIINFTENAKNNITQAANHLVTITRAQQKKQGKVDALLHQYDLSTEEGVALMCLAEALLRIPDKKTIDKLISDKISSVEWKNHLTRDNSFFLNAATWSLLLTGKVYSPTLETEKSLSHSLKKAVSNIGISMVRPIILQMMKIIGKQFVVGEDITAALKAAQSPNNQHYYFSYDMLGEAARTQDEARHYFNLYNDAIDAIGQSVVKSNSIEKNPSISIKLSALHPRYEYTQYERVMAEIPPLLLKLALKAKQYHIGITVDAEETDRLDLSLDIYETIFTHPSLNGWEGLGLAVQAYQKRAFYVIDWLADLSKRQNKRMMVRLVKGAYWDAEIKMTQVQGFADYPVFTRKQATDVSYLACARKLLSQPNYFYSQFGTHNAYSVAALLEMEKEFGGQESFEFQCLYGMGHALYDQIVDPQQFNRACRIYAPVGTHENLLGYLVRRLLENGANSSFVNRLADEKIPLEKITADPLAFISALKVKPHPKILPPKDIYPHWQNSQGIDLSNRHECLNLKQQMETNISSWRVGSIIKGKLRIKETEHENTGPVECPSSKETIGYVTRASEAEIEETLKAAVSVSTQWAHTPFEERALILERAAELFQKNMPKLATILTREAGKCIFDCLSEIRETIDYCRYYAYRAREDLKPHILPGPTGEFNQLTLHPRGIITCISPWNFPLAIFTGQILAALVTGNCVIAKPAEQTPIIAATAVQILHEAGIPSEVLQLLIGRGSVVGAKLVADERVAGVMLTGSTDTAKSIEKTLANRAQSLSFLIAETGGQNAMIVDSSALAEQTVIDIVQSAFNSSGQRCSALRVLFVQEEIAPKLLEMLKGYMSELVMGDPTLLATDIGPVIDDGAQKMLLNHFHSMCEQAKLLAQVSLPKELSGYYFAPCVFELENLSILKGEVFGPILHVIRYKAKDLDQVIDTIIQTGYGLTLGIQSRIDNTIQYISKRVPVGNIYVNRNMIGAVVGVQPFGGERLSGTGPKAGGPHYLPRLCVERSISINTTAVGGNATLVTLAEEA